MILTDNGYLDYVENKYYFYVRDHLGNNRVVTDLNLQSVQSTQYYPFGMAMGISLGQAKQPYKFGGKEFDMAFGVNMYDQVFRLFGSDDPTTPTPDPLAEKYPWMSPYAQMGLNPLRYVDPDGRDIYALTENERIVLALKTDDNFDRLWTFTTDKDGNIKSTATNVADQDFLPQLAANPNSTSYNATTSNKTDAFNVFKATSDASNFEWSLSGYKDKGSTKFYLNTQHSPGYAETGESNGVFEANNMLFNVHSHSQDDGAKGGSGYIYNYDFKTQMPYLKGYDSSGGSDGILAKYLYETTGKVMPLYVYHRGTQGLYKYTPWNYAAKSWLNVQSGTRMKSIIRP
jgi:RHS repeat-associated protein